MPFRSDRISVLSFDSFLDNWYHLKKQKQSCGIEGLCPFVLNALHPTNLRQKTRDESPKESVGICSYVFLGEVLQGKIGLFSQGRH